MYFNIKKIYMYALICFVYAYSFLSHVMSISEHHCPMREVDEVEPALISVVQGMCKLMTNNHGS